MSTQRHYEREREREFQISNLTQRESHQRCEGESKDKIPVMPLWRTNSWARRDDNARMWWRDDCPIGEATACLFRDFFLKLIDQLNLNKI